MIKLKNKGISIIEVVIGLAAISIIGVAFFSIHFKINKNEKKITLINTLIEKKLYFDEVLNNDYSIINTIKNSQNLNMDCIRKLKNCDQSFVSDQFKPGLDRIVLNDSHGNFVYDSRLTNTKGFTEDGLECTGFEYSGVGNDACPIGYIITWYLDNSKIDAENNITITSKVVYNPSDANKLKPWINSLLDEDSVTPYDSARKFSFRTEVSK